MRYAGEANSDRTLEALYLDTPGWLPWWPEGQNEVHRLLLHAIAETPSYGP